MATYDLTALDLSDLDEALLVHLLTVGEPLHVERKRDLPSREDLSELLGSMGNTDGGWALIGVADDGTVVGLAPSASDLQDVIRDRVGRALDPLPNFAARRETVGGVEIGVVRVYRSDDTPLVCTHKGAAYVRIPGGKRGVDSRREMDDLIERGRSSDGDARERLRTSTAAATALSAPELNGAAVYDESRFREWVLRAAPLGLDPGFGTRIRTQAFRQAVENASLRLLPPAPARSANDEWSDLEPAASGWISWGRRDGEAGAGAVVVDPAGVVTTMARERGIRAVINLEPLIEETIVPLVIEAMNVFAAADVTGRFLCDLHGRGFSGVTLQAAGHGSVQMRTGTRKSQTHGVTAVGGVDEVRAVAGQLAADLAGDAGLLTFS